MSKEAMIDAGQKNLRVLIAEIGSEKNFIELCEMSDSHVYNWLRKEPPQSITAKMAIRIEDAFDKKRGWLHDHLLFDEHGEEIKPKRPSRTKNIAKISPDAARLRHDQLDTIVAEYILDTGKRPSETNLITVMQWSYGKTLA